MLRVALRYSWLQGKVHAECFVELVHGGRGQSAQALADAIDRHRPNLLSMCLGAAAIVKSILPLAVRPWLMGHRNGSETVADPEPPGSLTLA